MSDPRFPIDGSCQCGGVTYQLLEAPLIVLACHCKECQKLSASAFSMTALVKRDTVKFSGELKQWERMADSGNKNCAKFCPRCGNRIYHFDPDILDVIKLKPGTLADTRWLTPSMHVWVSEKQHWYEIPDGVRQFDRQPPT